MVAPSRPVCILVTGFGAFPGTRQNPSAALVRALEKDRTRLARLGIALELATLPVVYAEIAPSLEALTCASRPDAILLFGLAARRKRVSIETRAANRLSRLRPDASGATPARLQILPCAPHAIRSTFPSREIAAALDRAEIACRLSSNAGTYICNQALYLSLAQTKAPQVGFIHAPRLAAGRRYQRNSEHGHTPTLDDLRRAAIIAVVSMARKLRCRCATAPEAPCRAAEPRAT
jgi:pyroglutamyl-peptidase